MDIIDRILCFILNVKTKTGKKPNFSCVVTGIYEIICQFNSILYSLKTSSQIFEVQNKYRYIQMYTKKKNSQGSHVQ